MFGSMVLDVVVGLVFIYLLYSILATIIAEIVANMIRLRSKTLERAIYRMLAPEQDNFWAYIGYRMRSFRRSLTMAGIYFLPKTQYRLNLEAKLKDRDFRDTFYNADVIKYLGKSKLHSKPSYLKPSTFSETVVELLKDSAVDNGEDPLTKEVEKLKTALAPTSKNTMSKALRKHLLSVLEEAKDDVDDFKALLESWYNETMARCSGWYKRQIQIILMGIGLCLAIVFNVDTLDIVAKLSKDKDAREQLVQLSSSFIESNPDLVSDLSATDSTSTATDSAIVAKIDTLLKTRKRLVKDINDANSIIALGWQVPDLVAQPVDTSKKYFSFEANSKTRVKPKTPIEWKLLSRIQAAQRNKPDSLKKGSEGAIAYYSSLGFDELKVKNQLYIVKPLSKFEKVQYVWSITNRRDWLGFFLTGLAISLGAPFWFDLLNKLMKLRGAGAKDEEKPRKAAAKPAS